MANEISTKVGITVLMACAALLFSFAYLGESHMSAQDSRTLSIQSTIEIVDITVSDMEPQENTELLVEVALRNEGAGDMTDVSVTLLQDDSPYETISGIAISANDSISVYFTWLAVEGNHNLNAQVIVGGNPFQESPGGVDLYVSPAPVGDVATPILLLGLIAVIVWGAVALPSILDGLNRQRQRNATTTLRKPTSRKSRRRHEASQEVLVLRRGERTPWLKEAMWLLFRYALVGGLIGLIIGFGFSLLSW